MSRKREPAARNMRRYHWDSKPTMNTPDKLIQFPVPKVDSHSGEIEVSVELRNIVWVVKALLDMCPNNKTRF